MAEHEMNLRRELMFGPAAKAKGAVIADAFTAYLNKPKALGSSDALRVGILNDHIGLMTLTDPLAAWTTFRNAYLLDHAPAGQDRYRSVLQAAVNVYHEDHGIPAIKLKAIPFQNQRIRFLSREDRDRLIASYPAHVRPIATMLAFQGPRTQEALQVQWGIGGVDMERETIFFARTKNGNPRSVAMHPRVKEALLPLWTDRGKPTSGHVFLNRVGEPYTDTRDLAVQGGNPISSAHNSACKK